jgi:hypothetical protein
MHTPPANTVRRSLSSPWGAAPSGTREGEGTRGAVTGDTPTGSDALLAANLVLIARRQPGLARALAQSPGAAHATFGLDAKGACTAVVRDGPHERRVCSGVDASAEAARWSASIDVTKHAAVVVPGWGCGHHVAALAKRVRHLGAIIAFEPDLALFRETLRRTDLSPWFQASNVVILHDPADGAALSVALQGFEGVLASGVHIAAHAAGRARLGKTFDDFAAALTHVMKAVRTNVVTTLVQSDVTARNCIQNLGLYASAPGVADLAGRWKGRPAVVVSAGPSLRRNLDLLTDPGVRDRVVIIAVQTTLKTLLARGIKPHFVVALDYHEISRRFYEGLRASDVEGVTLVIDPKCNPAIPASFPGTVRCIGDDIADRVAGEGLWRDMGRVRPGSTVAHLAYYLARHLGCDPVIMIGQDLAFTDHHYYAPGAAIHETWAGELNDFNTLEMLEWERIARMRHLLRAATDQHGRRIYTDEQMATYLVHFERDFAADVQAGLTIIDATEGGVAKAHTLAMPLREALDRHACDSIAPVPSPAASLDATESREGASTRLRDLLRGTRGVAKLSRETATLLQRMIDRYGDRAQVDRLIQRVQEIASQVAANPAFWFVQFINQTGQLRRFKADRAIELDDSLSPEDRQKATIRRDLDNVKWLADAADFLETLLESGLATLAGSPPVTRDPSVADEDAVRVTRASRRVVAAIALDTPCASLPRTLERLERASSLASIIVAAPAGSEALSQARSLARGRIVAQSHDDRTVRERFRRAALARAWSRHCWRGGIARLTIHDEAFHPGLFARLLESNKADACTPIGSDWACVDPRLIDDAADRFLERPDTYGLTFTQAAPGLGACVLAASTIREAAGVCGSHASIGGLLGYVPVAPQADPITKPVCPAIAAAARDALLRCTFSTPAELALLDRIPRDADAAAVAALVRDHALARPRSIETVELVIDRHATAQHAVDALRSIPAGDRPPAVTLRGESPALEAIVDALRACGVVAIHVRTSLPGAIDQVRQLLDAPIDVISVDLVADSRDTYRAMTGRDDYAAVREAMELLIRESRADEAAGGGLPSRWIVPRITRAEACLDELEMFHDRWLLVAGASVIDPPSPDLATSRIDALPLPRLALSRRDLTHARLDLTIDAGRAEPKPDLAGSLAS